MPKHSLVLSSLCALAIIAGSTPASSTSNLIGPYVVPTFSATAYGAFGDGASHTVQATLGVTNLSGLQTYSTNYAWVADSTYGLTFSLAANTAQSGAGTIITYTPPTTNNQTAPTATAYNYQTQADFVLPGMTVSNGTGTSCIASGTTVSAVATALPFSITTALPSSSGSQTIQMPFTGGITIGTTVHSSAAGRVPSGATVTAINAASTPATAYVTTTTGSNIVTVTSGATPSVGQVAAPSLRGDTGTFLLVFPPLTTVTAVNGAQVTLSNKPNFAGTNLPLAFETAPSITISAPLTGAIPAGTSIFFDGMSQVTLSTPTASACPANAAITYAYSDTMVQALEMDWLGLQSAVVAAAGVVTHGAQVHIPAGSYKLSRMLALPANGTNSILVTGDGILNTVLVAQIDTGRGTCAMGENNRAGGNLAAEYSSFQLEFINTPYTVGLEPATMSGLCMGESAQAAQVDVRSFHAGYDLLNDHQKIMRSQAEYNWFGIEMAANSQKGGNQSFNDNEILAEGLSSLAAGWNFGIDSAIISNTHTGFSPYGYYREGAPYGQTVMAGWLTNTQLNNVGGEALGNGWMYGENGVADLASSNVFINTSPSIDPNRGYNIPSQGIYSVINVGQFQFNSFVGSNLAMGNGGGASDFTFVTCALICAPAASSLVGSNNWLDVTSSGSMISGTGVVNQSFTAAPIFVSQYSAGNAWSTGATAGLLAVTNTAVTVGQLMAYSYVISGASTTPMTTGAVPWGVAVNAAAANGVVAVAQTGIAAVNATHSATTAAHAYLSTSTPTSVTTASAPDANTSQVIGTFLQPNQVFLRISP